MSPVAPIGIIQQAVAGQFCAGVTAIRAAKFALHLKPARPNYLLFCADGNRRVSVGNQRQPDNVLVDFHARHCAGKQDVVKRRRAA